MVNVKINFSLFNVLSKKILILKIVGAYRNYKMYKILKMWLYNK